MALLPMGPATDHRRETQESMFEDLAVFPTLEPYESTYEAAEELPYEAAEDYSEDFVEPMAELREGSEENMSHNEPELPEWNAIVNSASPAVPEPAPVSVAPPALPIGAAPPVVSEYHPESAVPLTVNDFEALEDRVLRAVALVRSERQARVAAEDRIRLLEAQVEELELRHPIVERLQREMDALRIEREQVRQRVDRLLSQLDALEL